MNLELRNKVVLITGGSRGIGEAITRTFAAEGALACILGRNPEDAAQVVLTEKAKGHHVEFYHVELTDEEMVQRAVEDIVALHGRIDVVINNAGGNDAVGLRNTWGRCFV